MAPEDGTDCPVANVIRSQLLFLCAALLAPTAVSAADACVERQPTLQTGPGPHDFSGFPTETRLWRDGEPGEPLLLRARVLDTCGRPISGARVRVLHANQDGYHEPDRWRTDLESNDKGVFQVLTVYPGWTGGIPRHIHFIIDHPAHPQLVTRLFCKNDPEMDESVEDLAIVLEKVRRNDQEAWIAGYEFVLAPR